MTHGGCKRAIDGKPSHGVILTLTGVTLGLTLGVISLSVQAQDADAAAPETQTAVQYYETHLGPSDAWVKATHKQRVHAVKAYKVAFGGFAGNGCKADLRHAYQGTTKHPENVQPYLPVTVLKVKGENVLMGEFVEGVCK